MSGQRSSEAIDAPKVDAWLSEHVSGATPPFRYELITGGRSNLTFSVTDAAAHHFVLRRPPLGTLLATAHDVVREYRIAAALAGTPVPVARALAVCDDTSINGTPFAVTGFVDGVVLDTMEKAAPLDLEARRALAFHMIDVLADLHAVDLDAVGLADLSRQDSYIERQLKRWSRQWAGSRTRELSLIDDVEKRLIEHLPPQHGATIVHGDYRFGNCISDVAARASRRRARLGAVHARRPDGRPRPSRRLLVRPAVAAAAHERPDSRRRLPAYAGATAALRRPQRARRSRGSTTTAASPPGAWRSSPKASPRGTSPATPKTRPPSPRRTPP